MRHCFLPVHLSTRQLSYQFCSLESYPFVQEFLVLVKKALNVIAGMILPQTVQITVV